MKRRIVYTNVIVLVLASAGCQLIADFEKDHPSAAGADAGGKANRGGGAGTTSAGASTSTGGTSTGSGGAASDGGRVNVGGTTAASGTDSRGGVGGAVVTDSGGGSGGSGTTSAGGSGGIGVATSVTSTGGTNPAGGTPQTTVAGGGAGMAGASNGGGSAGRTGTTTGGTTSSGGSGTGGALPNPCASQPCLNGGTCTASGASYTCKCVGGYFGPLCETARIEWLGERCAAHALTPDGKMVVGATITSVNFVPARWTKETGFQTLESLTEPIDSGRAYAVNSDGSVIVGEASTGSAGGAFRWNAKDGVVSLGLDRVSVARGVSSNGLAIVGTMYGNEATPQLHAFRWTAAGGVKDLFALNGGSVAGVSGDGAAIAGTYTPAGGPLSLPFLWNAVQGVTRLSNTSAHVVAISLDGSTVVGNDFSQGVFRYVNTSGTSYLDLGSLTFTGAVSADGNGSKLVGNSQEGIWLWEQSTGVRMLADILSSYGVDISKWKDIAIVAMSADGKVLVGDGYNGTRTTCWIARI